MTPGGGGDAVGGGGEVLSRPWRSAWGCRPCPPRAVVECSMTEASSLDGVVVACDSSRWACQLASAAAEQKHLNLTYMQCVLPSSIMQSKAMQPAW